MDDLLGAACSIAEAGAVDRVPAAEINQLVRACRDVHPVRAAEINFRAVSIKR